MFGYAEYFIHVNFVHMFAPKCNEEDLKTLNETKIVISIFRGNSGKLLNPFYLWLLHSH